MKTARRKPKSRFTLLAALVLGWIVGYETATYLPDPQVQLLSPHEAAVQVRFSPGGHCTQLVEAVIAKAQEVILVQAYYFTSAAIADALIAAHQRGVTVQVLVDQSQLTYKQSQVKRLVAQGIAVSVDKVAGIAHNKIMIVDEDYVLTGSFNWTQAAEARNAENLLLIQGKDVNQCYKMNWEQRASKASVLKF